MLLHSISALTPQEAVCAAETEDIYVLIYYIVYCLLWLYGGVTAWCNGTTRRYNVMMEHCGIKGLWMFYWLWITSVVVGCG